MPSALWSAFAHPADRKPRARSQGFGKRKCMVGMPRPKKAKVNATEDGGSVGAEVDSAIALAWLLQRFWLPLEVKINQATSKSRSVCKWIVKQHVCRVLVDYRLCLKYLLD